MFEILCAGRNYPHDENFEINREFGYPHYLALFIKSPCRLKSDGEIREFPKGTFILFNKNSPHYYAANNSPYIDDWIQFDCSEDFLKDYTEYFNKPFVVNDMEAMENYYQLIIRIFFRGISNCEIIDHLIFALFSEVFTTNHSDFKVPHFSKLNKLRHDIHSNPEKQWSIKNMADSLNLSEAYLQEIYKKAFGTSCIAEVINSRIMLAKNLLTGTTKDMQQISEDCGYNSVVHFSRQFKSETGFSPSQWRKEPD